MDSTNTDREWSEFLLRACHDLRASARAVRTHSELIRKDVADLRNAADLRNPGFEQRLGFIVDGAQKIDLLLDGLARYSIALQTDPEFFQTVPMDVLLRSVLMKLTAELRDSGAEVVSGELPAVFGNPDRLTQLLENLLRNAIEHRADPAPRIRVSAARQQAEWLIAVRDNGPGVEAAYLNSIFKPFERLPGRQRLGAGLGLAACRAIVQRHGGRIWAESQPGSGATFFFTLPAPESLL